MLHDNKLVQERRILRILYFRTPFRISHTHRTASTLAHTHARTLSTSIHIHIQGISSGRYAVVIIGQSGIVA